MKFGLVYDFRNPAPWRRPFPELYAALFEQIRHAEALGFDEVWITEHHFVEDGYTPSVLPVAAAIAARTERIRIGTWVLLLPLHNALRVAEDAATVDIISGGRFDLGLGLGYRVAEFEAFGVPRRERRSRMEEGVEVIRRAWTEQEFSFEGRHYHLKNVRLTPKPVQVPHPPIWLGARSRPAAERAARFECPLMLVAGREIYDVYAHALRARGRDPRDFELLTQFQWFLSEDPEGAWRAIAPQVRGFFESYADWYGEAADLETDRMWTAQLRDEAAQRASFRVTTPEACVSAIEAYLREVPATHLISYANPPGVAPDLAARSLELFARHVMPRFKGAGVAGT